MLTQLIGWIPRLIGALVILIVGWIVATVLSAVVRGALRRSGIDRRLASATANEPGDRPLDLAELIGRIVFYLVLVFVVIGVLQALDLALVLAPLALLLSGVFGFLPKLFGAALLILLAWIFATIARIVVRQLLVALRLDERLSQAGAAQPSSQTLAQVAYYLVFLFFLPAILSTLGLDGLLLPVQNTVDEILVFLPHLVSAAIILVIGIFIARLFRGLVTDVLAAAGADRLGARLGLVAAPNRPGLSGLLGLVVYVLVLLPAVTAALDALQLPFLTGPISNMLNRLLAAVPNIFAAAVLLAVAYVVGRLIGGLVTELLTGFGFDTLPARLGLTATPVSGGAAPASLVGWIVQIAIVLFAVIEALQLLGFTAMASVVTGFITLAGHILLGIIILGITLYLARLAAAAVQSSGVTNARLVGRLAQVAVLIFGGAIALRQMGIADEIINLAFALLLGSVAVAAAVAFGIGGRDIARQQLERFVTELDRPTLPPPAASREPLGEAPVGD